MDEWMREISRSGIWQYPIFGGSRVRVRDLWRKKARLLVLEKKRPQLALACGARKRGSRYRPGLATLYRDAMIMGTNLSLEKTRLRVYL